MKSKDDKSEDGSDQERKFSFPVHSRILHIIFIVSTQFTLNTVLNLVHFSLSYP